MFILKSLPVCLAQTMNPIWPLHKHNISSQVKLNVWGAGRCFTDGRKGSDLLHIITLSD